MLLFQHRSRPSSVPLVTDGLIKDLNLYFLPLKLPSLSGARCYLEKYNAFINMVPVSFIYSIILVGTISYSDNLNSCT